jgi:hypothetical protein
MIGEDGGVGARNDIIHSRNFCGVCKFSTAGAKNVRLMYKQDLVSGSALNARTLNASTLGALTGSALNFTARPLRQQIPAPVFFGSTQAVKYYAGSSVSLPTGTPTLINFNTSLLNTFTVDPVTTGPSWKFTASSTGVYLVSIALRYDPSGGAWAATNQVDARLYKNGSFFQNMTFVQAMGAGSFNIGLASTTPVFLTAGEYIDVRAFQNSGVTQQILSGDYSFISVIKLIN